MYATVTDILKKVKLREMGLDPGHSVPPTTPLREALRRLDEERRAALVICDEGRVVGIFTQRDVLNRPGLERLDPELPVADVMTREPTCLTTDQSLTEALAAMVAGGYRQVPLVDGEGKLVSLLRSRDVLRYVAGFFPEAVLNLPPRLHQTLTRSHGG